MSNVINLGSSALDPSVAAALAVLGNARPSDQFQLNVSGTALASLFVGAAIAGAPAVQATVATSAPAPAPAADAPAAESTVTRFRRTKAETEAGLSVEEAVSFRASGMTDPVAYKASLAMNVAPVAPASAAPAETPPAPPPPPPPPPADPTAAEAAALPFPPLARMVPRLEIRRAKMAISPPPPPPAPDVPVTTSLAPAPPPVPPAHWVVALPEARPSAAWTCRKPPRPATGAVVVPTPPV